ncbi:MAG: aspartate--tRNA ligase, partial [Candidatus Electryoneaceae bacterium]|nr:aspartate--tRNA ligase [Candidatus Electryoneaceae bacterium]
LHNEDVVKIKGTVSERPEGMRNPNMPTGEIEIETSSIDIISRADPLPIGVEDEEEPGEELRLRYRYLDLRRDRMQHNLRLRHRALQSVRKFHDEAGFIEIETPYLIRSTPEGARDYIVPSRIHPGSCFALPQSPQLYKQSLMIGGIDKYFQIARCFRDEDLRRDRRPEFSQIDVEMSFVTEEDVFEHTELMMQRLVRDVLDRELSLSFDRITYKDALNIYGSDAPDMRYKLKIVRSDDLFRDSGFKAFESVLESGGAVFGLLAEGKGTLSRKLRTELEDLAKKEGLAGLLSLPVKEGEFAGIIGKLLSPERQESLKQHFNAEPGDLLMFAAGDPDNTLAILGRFRRLLAARWDLTNKDDLHFCWVVNPPLFEPLTDGDGLTAVHHPFTAPVDEDIEKILTDPLSVNSRAYDLVLNGIEMATGSIRIHNSTLQEKVFQAIGFDHDEANRRFGFLLEALRYGAPPHAGIALGFDRLVMVLSGEMSIRNVIAFPKTNTAFSLMDGAPSPLDDRQWLELGLSTVDK